MKTADIKFDSSQVIELSFATIKEGMEQQLFQDYFPKVGPIVADLGGKSLGSFTVDAAASKIGTPKMGAFFQWPDIEGYKKLHDDARFLKVKPIRDETLAFFSNGHFFNVEADKTIGFAEGQDYALVAEWTSGDLKKITDKMPLVTLRSAMDGNYAPSKLHICLWDDAFSALVSDGKAIAANAPDIYKFKLNMPA